MYILFNNVGQTLLALPQWTFESFYFFDSWRFISVENCNLTPIGIHAVLIQKMPVVNFYQYLREYFAGEKVVVRCNVMTNTKFRGALINFWIGSKMLESGQGYFVQHDLSC